MCILCNPENENIIYQNDLFRVILVDEIPGFIRIIANRHIKELSDLEYNEFLEFSKATYMIEKSILKTIKPDKINIATLGNYVPHLHIHIIPRYKNDSWYPDSIWSPKVREYKYNSTQSDIENLKKDILRSFNNNSNLKVNTF